MNRLIVTELCGVLCLFPILAAACDLQRAAGFPGANLDGVRMDGGDDGSTFRGTRNCPN